MNFAADKAGSEVLRKKIKGPMRDTSKEDFLALVDAHVIVREEVYTLAQFLKGCNKLKDNQSSDIDIKPMSMKRFGERIGLGKPQESVNNASKYVCSASINFTHCTKSEVFHSGFPQFPSNLVTFTE